MTTALPKIWNTTFTTHPTNMRNMGYHLPDNSRPNRLALSRAFHYPDGKPLSKELIPDFIYFNRGMTAAYKKGTPDWVKITDGIQVISERFRDFLAGFDLGANEIFEVPLYEHDGRTLRPGRWFIFHLCETKDTLVPEQSKGLELRGETAGYFRSALGWQDVLAAKASAAEGADIWLDLHILSRIFLSDRLKSALEPAGIRVAEMPIRPCIVVA